MGYTACMKRYLIAMFATILLTSCAPAPVELALTPETPRLPTRAVRTPTPTLVARPTDTPLPSPTPSPAPTPTRTGTPLTLWESLPPAQQVQLATDIAAFQQDNPTVKITIQHYDDPSALVDGIVNGRVDFDLILGVGNTLSPLQQAGLLQPMDAFFPPSFLDAFAGSTLAGITAEGQVWGLPDTAGFHLLLFYNRKLLASPPANIAALESAAAVASTGTAGLVMNTADPLWVLPWMGGNDGGLVDDAGAPRLDSPAMVVALGVYARLVAITGDVPQTYAEARQKFLDGQAMMLIDGDWMLPTLRQSPDLPWAVAKLPATDGGLAASPLVLARYWAVGAQTSGRRAEAAIQLLEYLVSAERQLTWATQFDAMPTRRDALNAPQLLTDATLRADAAQLQTGQSLPLGVDANHILDAMRRPLADFLMGKIDAKTTASQMQSAVE